MYYITRLGSLRSLCLVSVAALPGFNEAFSF